MILQVVPANHQIFLCKTIGHTLVIPNTNSLSHLLRPKQTAFLGPQQKHLQTHSIWRILEDCTWKNHFKTSKIHPQNIAGLHRPSLRILTPQNLLFWGPWPLLYRFKPFHWRVQGFLGLYKKHTQKKHPPLTVPPPCEVCSFESLEGKQVSWQVNLPPPLTYFPPEIRASLIRGNQWWISP